MHAQHRKRTHTNSRSLEFRWVECETCENAATIRMIGTQWFILNETQLRDSIAVVISRYDGGDSRQPSCWRQHTLTHIQRISEWCVFAIRPYRKIWWSHAKCTLTRLFSVNFSIVDDLFWMWSHSCEWEMGMYAEGIVEQWTIFGVRWTGRKKKYHWNIHRRSYARAMQAKGQTLCIAWTNRMEMAEGKFTCVCRWKMGNSNQSFVLFQAICAIHT